MFKGIMNGLSSNGKEADLAGDEIEQHSGDEQAAGQCNEQKLKKKSKSKFSSMMGKFHSKSGKNKLDQEATNGNNFNYMIDETDILAGDLKDGCKVSKDDKAAYVLPEEQCDIPTFLQTNNCDAHLIEETRKLLQERYAKNPDSFYDHDYKRMLSDDWTVSRFLLRRRLDPKRTAKLMEECGRFRKQYKMSEMKLHEFPIEFHKAGGLFRYATDRVGNVTLYMRVKMYRRVPEISDVFKAFILCVLEECDMANGGRGTAVIFDLSGCGLQNVDLSFLSWLLSSFRNYCPKGVSYILVYNLPWILNATCKLAMTWMSSSNRRALRFVYGDEIENFISRENLPDYLGGSCKINYKAIPEGSKPALDVCEELDISREQALKIRELFAEYLDEDDDQGQQQDQDQDQSAKQAKSNTSEDKQQLQVAKSEPDETGNIHKSASTPAELVSQASKYVA